MGERAKAFHLAEVFAELLAPASRKDKVPGVKAVGAVHSENAQQLAVFDVEFDEGVTYRVKVERQ